MLEHLSLCGVLEGFPAGLAGSGLGREPGWPSTAVLPYAPLLVQTTNKIFNPELFDALDPATLLSWQRVRTANWLARGGEVWGVGGAGVSASSSTFVCVGLACQLAGMLREAVRTWLDFESVASCLQILRTLASKAAGTAHSCRGVIVNTSLSPLSHA